MKELHLNKRNFKNTILSEINKVKFFKTQILTFSKFILKHANLQGLK